MVMDCGCPSGLWAMAGGCGGCGLWLWGVAVLLAVSHGCGLCLCFGCGLGLWLWSVIVAVGHGLWAIAVSYG